MGEFNFSSAIFYDGAGARVTLFDSPGTLTGTATDDGMIDIDDPNFNFGVYLFDGSFTANGHLFLVYTFDTDGSSFIYSPTAPSTSDAGFPATYTTGSVTLDTSAVPLCFAAGTLVSRPDGDRAVENLRIGDKVHTLTGEARVKWVGRQTLSKWHQRERIQPVRICAGALGDDLPLSDLVVTADHGMFVDGYVINASALVNHETIAYVPMAELEERFTVYHIETENHDVIFANGAPSETFVDFVTRSHFDNHKEYIDLYGAERVIREMPHPRIASQRLVPQAIKDRLGIGVGYGKLTA